MTLVFASGQVNAEKISSFVISDQATVDDDSPGRICFGPRSSRALKNRALISSKQFISPQS